MIRTAFLTLFATLLLASCGQERWAERDPIGSPALWVVEDEGKTVGWLFGTIHALPDGASWQTPALDRAVAAAGVLVVEVRDLDPARLTAEFKRLASDDPGPPLAARISRAERDDLAELLQQKGASSGQFDGFETWAAALALAQLGDAVKPGNSADKALLTRFGGRPVQELEGAADQLAMFDALPERGQRTMLAAVIAEQDRAEADATALARAWLAGDTARIERLARTGLLADPTLYEILLARRNRMWVTPIVELIERDERPLVAVGAAHLLGRDGLPSLLMADGYTVRRIQ